MKTLVALFVGLFFATASVFAQEGLENIQYDDDGRFAVQVEAWRCDIKAESRVNFWKEQGFDHSTFAREGNEANGDVWFRVYLGRFANADDAEHFREVFAGMFDVETWVTTTTDVREPVTNL